MLTLIFSILSKVNGKQTNSSIRQTGSDFERELEEETQTHQIVKFHRLDKPNGYQKMIDKLSNMTNLQLISIDLTNIHVQKQQMIQLSEVLSKHTDLEALNVQCKNLLKEKTGRLFSDAIRQLINLTQLQLELDGGQVGDELFGYLCKALIDKRRLKSLSLSLLGNKITEKGGQFLGETLKNFDLNEFKLNLYANNLESLGLQSLCRGLDIQYNLIEFHLNLQSNLVGSEGLKSLCEILKKNQGLTVLNLDLQYNQICPQGALNLAETIQHLINIQNLTLFLRSNQIGDDGALEIGRSIYYLTNLQDMTIDIGANGLSSHVQMVFVQLFKSSSFAVTI